MYALDVGNTHRNGFPLPAELNETPGTTHWHGSGVSDRAASTARVDGNLFRSLLGWQREAALSACADRP